MKNRFTFFLLPQRVAQTLYSLSLPIFFALYLFFPLSQAAAQQRFLRFENISIQNGLSQSSALCLLQDSKGFLWVGTADGLNRYDSYDFQIYRQDFQNKKSINNHYINDLAEDEEGNIWVATRAGLSKYSWETDSFTTFLIDSISPAYNHILTLATDQQGKIWLGTQDKGVFCFDKKSQTFKEVPIIKTLKNKLKNEIKILVSNDLCFDNKYFHLWVASETGLIQFDTKADTTIKVYRPLPNNENNLPDIAFAAVFPDEHGNIWAGTYNGHVARWNRTTKDFLSIKLPTSQPQPYGANQVKAILQTRNKDIWVGTLSTGLYLLTEDQKNGKGYKIQNFQQDNEDAYSLKDNDIVSLLEDKNDILWIGAFGGGISKNDSRYNLFNAYRHAGGHPQSLVQNGIRSILEDSKGNLWIGMTNKGIKKFHKDGKTVSSYEYQPENPFSIPSNRINTIFEDKKGRIWVGCGDGGFCLYQESTNKQGNFISYNMNNLYKPLSSSIYTIKEDTEQNLWIGTKLGLVKLDSTRKKVEIYRPHPTNSNSLSGEAVRAINIDNEKKQLWIGTFEGGITRFDLKKNLFKSFVNQKKLGSNSISENSISNIYKDNYGTIWIGTFGGGLNKFDLKTQKFSYITENEGLANNVVYGILEDKQNNLWLSTNRGISRYNIMTKQILNYNLADGLQSDEFNANAYHKGKSGIFYFGGINGLTSLKPDSISNTVQTYPVLVTDFKLFNKSVKPDSSAAIKKHISEVKEIVLSYNDYVFSFSFAALNFNTPYRVRYAYKMEGFDKDWIPTSYTNRMANYSNLPAGNYIFMVKATNSNGAWMDNQVEIKITIKPAIWNTIWFKAVCLLLVVVGVIVLVTLRIRRIQKQREELEKLVYLRTAEIVHQKEEILQQRDTIENQLRQLETALNKLQISEQELSELNEAKNKFFSIFAHDLRSPLNSLKGFSSLLANFADELSKEEIKNIALDLDKNINNSTKYLENLLTWARSQMNSIEFKPEILNLADCMTISTELLQVNAQTKQITLLKEVDKDLLIWADSNQFKTILTNLIANAIKFTEPKGTVTIKAEPNFDEDKENLLDNFLIISVKDTGVGMPPNVLEKIFRIDTKHSTKGTQGESGTGLGLLLCKEFVEKNGGKIWVESQENRGTTFYFTIKQV